MAQTQVMAEVLAKVLAATVHTVGQGIRGTSSQGVSQGIQRHADNGTQALVHTGRTAE